MKLTNIHKHFVLMLLLGILAWAFVFFGKAQGLGYFLLKTTKNITTVNLYD